MAVVSILGGQLLLEIPADVGLEMAPRPTGPGLEGLLRVPGSAGPSAWMITRSAAVGKTTLHPWDNAHQALHDPAAFGLEMLRAPSYAEPDFSQRFPHRGLDEVSMEALEAASPCTYAGPDPDWPPADLRFAWHLEDDYSELAAAGSRVGDRNQGRVRVAILDTGYDPEHVTRPLHLLAELQRNFVDGDPADATDPGRHFPLNNPGHGTATMALLAGNRVRPPGAAQDIYLGGAPFAEVVPVRIADAVVHFYSSAMAAGIEYAIEAGCQVISISMGGVPTRAWATAVNRAYEAGIAIFAAAGNRIGPSPPSSIVYPARFNRVIAVCGAMADKKPYFKPGLHRKMHGCFGPPAKMATSLTAYTPNTPWAVMGCSGLVSHDGAGTSSATPQAAAAAALWLQRARVPQDVEPWQRVEAVRNALFVSADKSRPEGQAMFGQGLLKANQALDVPFRADLPMTPPDAVSFPWLRMLGALEAVPSGHELMYEVEALQVYLQSRNLQDLTSNADPVTDELDAPTRKRLLRAFQESPLASKALRDHAGDLQKRL